MPEKITTKAIILKRVPYGDADWIVHVFSRDAGRLSGMAKSARKSLRRFGSGLEPGAVTNLTYTARPHSVLVQLQESEVVFSTTGMMRSLKRIEAMARALNIALSFLKEHQAAPDKFELMAAYLYALSQEDPPPSMRLGFEIKWLALAGFEPHLHCCVSCGAEERGDAAFSMQDGGVVCRDCLPNETPAVVLTSRMRDDLCDMLSRPIGMEAPLEDARPISSLIERYAEYILAHHLR